MNETKAPKSDSKLDAILEAAKRIEKEVSPDNFAVVFAAYVAAVYGVNFVTVPA